MPWLYHMFCSEPLALVFENNLCQLVQLDVKGGVTQNSMMVYLTPSWTAVGLQLNVLGVGINKQHACPLPAH